VPLAIPRTRLSARIESLSHAAAHRVGHQARVRSDCAAYGISTRCSAFTTGASAGAANNLTGLMAIETNREALPNGPHRPRDPAAKRVLIVDDAIVLNAFALTPPSFRLLLTRDPIEALSVADRTDHNFLVMTHS